MYNIAQFDKTQGFNVSERYKAVNTPTLVKSFEANGYEVSKISTAKVRNADKQGYQKHLIRLSHPDLVLNTLADIKPEIVISNSYDGSASFRLMMGVFRIVCANGLVVGSTYESIKVRHVGDALTKVLEAAVNVQKQTERISAQIDNWSRIELTDADQVKFAQKASLILLPQSIDQNVIPLVRAETLLRIHRSDDTKKDLFTVFNRIQENAIRGGLSYVKTNAQGVTRNQTARRINSIDRNLLVNRALWDLATKIEQGELEAA
jgi:hypothetical protein